MKTLAWKLFGHLPNICASNPRQRRWRGRHLLGDSIFTRKVKPRDYIDGDAETIQVGLFELIDAFQKILQRVSKDHTVEFEADEVTVKDRMNDMIQALEDKGSVTFAELFAEKPAKRFVIVTFLALLELMKLNLIRVAQSAQSGVIRLFYQ
jgi:segregation and condensation protein A